MEEECETPEKEQIVDDCRIQEVRNPWRFASMSRNQDCSVLENWSGSGVIHVEDICIIGEGDLLVPDSSKSSSDSKACPRSSRSSGSSWMELSNWVQEQDMDIYCLDMSQRQEEMESIVVVRRRRRRCDVTCMTTKCVVDPMAHFFALFTVIYNLITMTACAALFTCKAELTRPFFFQVPNFAN